jgi:hypothetical protein
MIYTSEMRLQLESMEQAATEVLQQDVAFFEALLALKQEIERDPRVRLALSNLRRSGHTVHSSFVPRIKVEIKTEQGIIALRQQGGPAAGSEVGAVTALTQELKNAATAAILNSRTRDELETIVNEAISASKTFENIASEIENRGYEVRVCLDLSSYAQVRKPANSVPHSERTNPRELGEQTYRISLSDYDLKFMKSLKIKADF